MKAFTYLVLTLMLVDCSKSDPAKGICLIATMNVTGSGQEGTTKYEYDNKDRVITSTFLSTGGNYEIITRYTYNDNGNIDLSVASTRTGPLPLGSPGVITYDNIENYEYDGNNSLIRALSFGVVLRTYQYNAAGQLTSSLYPMYQTSLYYEYAAGTTAKNPSRYVTKTSYGFGGGVTVVQSCGGTWQFDDKTGQGKLLGLFPSIQWDNNATEEHVNACSGPGGTINASTTTYTYGFDPHGNLTSSETSFGQKIQYTYLCK